jgi:thymidylate synthase (FAD)
MTVKLINYSKGNTNTIIDEICYCARVSNPANQQNTETNDKLINYLIKNKHWSPFEMVNICLEIETSRDIGRQILRHRSFSFQEFSQRYALADLGFNIRETRLQDKKNRQNSIETENLELQNKWEAKQKEIINICNENYKWAIENNIAKEQARCILPEGLIATRMYMNGSLRSWIHYIQLRTENSTQKEHREIAIECANEIAKIFPMIMSFVS